MPWDFSDVFFQGCSDEEDVMTGLVLGEGSTADEGEFYAVGYTRGNCGEDGSRNSSTSFSSTLVHKYAYSADGLLELVAEAPAIIGESGDAELNAVVLAPDGGVIVCGYVTGAPLFQENGTRVNEDFVPLGDEDMLVIRVSANLQVLKWVTPIGDTGADRCSDIAVEPEGFPNPGFVTVGGFTSRGVLGQAQGANLAIFQLNGETGKNTWIFVDSSEGDQIITSLHYSKLDAKVAGGVETQQGFYVTGWTGTLMDRNAPRIPFLERVVLASNPNRSPSAVWVRDDFLAAEGFNSGELVNAAVAGNDTLFIAGEVYYDGSRPTEEGRMFIVDGQTGSVLCSVVAAQSEDSAAVTVDIRLTEDESQVLLGGYSSGNITGTDLINSGGNDILITAFEGGCTRTQQIYSWLRGTPQDDALYGLVTPGSGSNAGMLLAGVTHGTLAAPGRIVGTGAGNSSDFLVGLANPYFAENSNTYFYPRRIFEGGLSLSTSALIGIALASLVGLVALGMLTRFLSCKLNRCKWGKRSPSSALQRPSSGEETRKSAGSAASTEIFPGGGRGIGSGGVTYDVAIAHEDVILGALLGEGFYGAVYRGRWHGQNVAVKRLKHISQQKSFWAEVATLTRLRHPNITYFYGACQFPEPLIVCELLWGSLSTLLHGVEGGKQRMLSTKLQYRLISDICQGLVFIHSKNIVHRDISSSNILVTASLKDLEALIVMKSPPSLAKLTDFGLSRDLDHGDWTVAAGNLKYIAPEVYRGEDLTVKSDAYSFSLVAWETFTGTRPFLEFASPQLAAYKAAIEGARPSLANVNTGLALLLQSCWHDKPAMRPLFQSILQTLDSLYAEGFGPNLELNSSSQASSLRSVRSNDIAPIIAERTDYATNGFEFADSVDASVASVPLSTVLPPAFQDAPSVDVGYHSFSIPESP